MFLSPDMRLICWTEASFMESALMSRHVCTVA